MLRLTINHPLSIKCDLLHEFLLENELEIEASPYGKGLTLRDTKSNVEANIKEVDQSEGIDCLPSHFEYKLIKVE